MIGYLKGTVIQVKDQTLLLDVNGVGYLVSICARDAQALPARGQEAQIFTWMSLGQDTVRLYGFLREDDLEIFKMLLNVSGIGPKAALGVLSVLTADDLRFAVLSGDEKAIAKAPGIAKKGAQKIILEMKDKFSLDDVMENGLHVSGQEGTSPAGMSAAQDEAVQALVSLGYSNSEAFRAVKNCAATEDMDTEAVLKLALKQL